MVMTRIRAFSEVASMVVTWWIGAFLHSHITSALHDTTQYNTVQYNAMQYNTIQYNVFPIQNAFLSQLWPKVYILLWTTKTRM